MKVSFVSGVCVKNDAISRAVLDEIQWLTEEGHQVKLFSYACDYPDVDSRIVGDVGDIVMDPHFQTSDLVVTHYGIANPLFDFLPARPRRARALVIFHNITPANLLAPEARPTIERSFRQLANIHFADAVGCDSQVNLDVLRAHGVKTPAKVLSLALRNGHDAPTSKPSFMDGKIRIAYVGRIVPSKGTRDLVEAIEIAAKRLRTTRFQVTLVGNLSFSDKTYVDQVRAASERLRSEAGGRVKFEIVGDASDETKTQILADADIFMLPTYHEGFCVPILEALSSGCRILTYENSNTPYISGGFAELVPTGDVQLLASALVKEVINISGAAWRTPEGGYSNYRRRTQAYVRGYAPDCTKTRFLEYVRHTLNGAEVKQ